MRDKILICYCGHGEVEHKLMLETYMMCNVCYEAGLLRNKFIHEFKPDNLRFLESLNDR